MDRSDYYDKLDAHDWYYELSDDMNKYSAGEESYKELRGIAAQSNELHSLFRAFKEHYFSGPAWNTVKQPKPVKSESL